MNTTNQKSKIALVTGGSRGLGKDMALRLAQAGKDVIITYNNKQEEAIATVKQIETMGQKPLRCNSTWATRVLLSLSLYS